MSTSQRLADLGIKLPPVATPIGSYVPAVRVGDLVFTAGQLPFVDGKLISTGRVDVATDTHEADPDCPTLELATECARVCVLNALAAAASAVGGVDNIASVIKLRVFVASSKRFMGQAKVADGASQVLADVFGDTGRHARAAVGVAALPMGATVEVELIVQAAA